PTRAHAGELPPEIHPAEIEAAVARPRGLAAVAELFGAAIQCWFESGVGELASAIAFQTQLSLAPFLLLVMTGTSLILGATGAQDALFDLARAYVSESVVPGLASVMDSAVSARGGPLVTAVSLVAMGFF